MLKAITESPYCYNHTYVYITIIIIIIIFISRSTRNNTRACIRSRHTYTYARTHADGNTRTLAHILIIHGMEVLITVFSIR